MVGIMGRRTKEVDTASPLRIITLGLSEQTMDIYSSSRATFVPAQTSAGQPTFIANFCGREFHLVEAQALKEFENPEKLEEFARFCSEEYRRGLLYHGAIYFANYDWDIRRSLALFELFRRICGREQIADNFVVAVEDGDILREVHRRNKSAILYHVGQARAKVKRYKSTRQLYMSVLSRFLDSDRVAPLGLQLELASEKIANIDDTKAGARLSDILQRYMNDDHSGKTSLFASRSGEKAFESALDTRRMGRAIMEGSRQALRKAVPNRLRRNQRPAEPPEADPSVKSVSSGMEGGVSDVGQVSAISPQDTMSIEFNTSTTTPTLVLPADAPDQAERQDDLFEKRLNSYMNTLLDIPETLDGGDSIRIAVMGATGSGKSTFVNLVTGSNLEVSNRLSSCTQSVQFGAATRIDNRSISMIDTPGFNDTSRTDPDVFNDIFAFLLAQSRLQRYLHGIIYVHSISTPRMGGGSVRAFNVFRELCGEEFLRNVVIVTTMWDKINFEEGEEREMELRNDERFFQPALSCGAQIIRHNNTRETAKAIIYMLLDNQPMPLRFQREMEDEHKNISFTAAGRELGKVVGDLLRKQEKELADIKEELKATDGDDRRMIELLQTSLEASEARKRKIVEDMQAMMLNDVPHRDIESEAKGPGMATNVSPDVIANPALAVPDAGETRGLNSSSGASQNAESVGDAGRAESVRSGSASFLILPNEKGKSTVGTSLISATAHDKFHDGLSAQVGKEREAEQAHLPLEKPGCDTLSSTTIEGDDGLTPDRQGSATDGTKGRCEISVSKSDDQAAATAAISEAERGDVSGAAELEGDEHLGLNWQGAIQRSREAVRSEVVDAKTDDQQVAGIPRSEGESVNPSGSDIASGLVGDDSEDRMRDRMPGTFTDTED